MSNDASLAHEGDPGTADYLAAIERSGYLMENRIHEKLEQAGYQVFSSRRIADPETGKSREQDFFARRHEVRSPDQFNERPAVNATLIVECVNNRYSSCTTN